MNQKILERHKRYTKISSRDTKSRCDNNERFLNYVNYPGRSMMDRLIAELHLVEMGREIKILDVGAGPQAFERYFMEKLKQSEIACNVNIIPVDVLRIDKILQRRKRNKYTVIGDAIELPFKNDVFDMIISNEVIGNMPEIIINEMFRVLKNNGVGLLNFKHLDRYLFRYKNPDGLARGMVNDIVNRFESAGFKKVVLDNKKGDNTDTWFEVKIIK